MSDERIHQDPTVTLLVSFLDASTKNRDIRDRVITIPKATAPEDIPQTVKNIIKPFRPADPTDNYKGSSPTDIQLINLINLGDLIA